MNQMLLRSSISSFETNASRQFTLGGVCYQPLQKN
jgi:hypothetical protein